MQVVEGASLTLTGKLCLVVYDEDLWLALPADRQAYCKEVWLTKASALPDVVRVVLRLTPDELFPMHGHEKPYIAWQQDIDRPPECGFQVTTVVTVEVVGDAKYVDPVMRADITAQLTKPRYPAGATYRIVNSRGDVMEHGRL